MNDRAGQQFGNYRLIRLLGKGSFAEVYLGEHIHLSNKAAIKVLHANLDSSQETEQFRAEARQLIELSHPHIVRMLDFGIEQGTPYLVMDYAANGTLRTRHPRGIQVPLATVISYVQQVADGLAYAHQEKLIHRDIKPENLLLGRRDEVLISDFGIAVVAHTHYDAPLNIAGTVTYMAPEQLQGQPQRASDQYALGIMVYEWLTGGPPFVGAWLEIASQQMLTPPPSLRAKNPAISPAVEEVVLTALAKDPKERFASIQSFVNAMKQASQEATRPAPVDPKSPGSTPAIGSGPAQIYDAATVVSSTPNVPTPAISVPEPSTPSSLIYDAATVFSSTPNVSPPPVSVSEPSTPPPFIYDPSAAVPFAPSMSLPAVNKQQPSTPPAFPPPPGSPPMRAPGSVRVSPTSRKRTPLMLLAACLLLVVLISGTLGVLGLSGKGPLAFIGTKPTIPTPGAVAGKITEFPLLHTNSSPSGIATGADGNLWFTEIGADRIGRIGRITPAGSITEFPLLSISKQLNDITDGADGNLWFNEFDVNRIGRITPTGIVREFVVPTPKGNPAGVSRGPDGNIWFTEEDGNRIGRITPSGTFQEYVVPTKQSEPFEITNGPDGNLWFTEFAANQIGRVTPSGAFQEFPIPTANSGPDRIVSGPDGNLWFTEYNTNKIGRITPAGDVKEFPVPTAQSHPIGITSGPDGNLWFAERDGNRIGRITPGGIITEFLVPTANSHLVEITAGPDRNLWFTESESGRIGRITSGR